jgi:fructokinase
MHLGIDLGGTKIEVAVLDSSNQFILRKRVDSPRGSYRKTLEVLTNLIREAENETRAQCTIGIGIPGSIHPESGRIQNANSTWLIGEDLASDLQSKLERPISIANDADCFTLSEATDGAAAGATSVFGVILGTGVGGGIFFRDRVDRGPNSIRGEWGHNAMHYAYCDLDRNASCYCGRQHCIETYLSGPALVKHYYSDSQKSAVVKRVEEIAMMAKSGDSAAQSCLSIYFKRLGAALSQVINLLDPEVIVMGGGLSNLDEIYIETPKYILEHLFSDRMRNKLVKARHGDSSGVRGAAWLGKMQQK